MTQQHTDTPAADSTAAPTPDAPFVITISRQLGSGGRQIAHEMADILGVDYYDKESLAQAALNSGLGHNVFDRNEKHKGFMRNFIGAVQPFFGGGDFYGPQLSEENLFKLESGVISKVASERSCIFAGRAADYILRNHERKVSIFLCADEGDRIRRVMDMKKVDYRNALRIINESDEERSGYYNFHAPGTWGSADNYDLCLNVSALGHEASLNFLLGFIRQKLGLEVPATCDSPIPEMF